MTVGIIGAGLAGLSAANRLSRDGVDSVVFDKARGVGGRTSIRRIFDRTFDIGAQYFTARSEEFQAQVDDWSRRGIAAVWEAPIAVLDREQPGQPLRNSTDTTRWIGVPGMNALAKDLSPQTLHVRTRIGAIDRRGDEWHLRSEGGEAFGPFSSVVLTLPAPQSVELLASSGLNGSLLPDFEFHPSWAVLVALDAPLDVPFGGAFVHGSSLGWIANHRTKPGRGPEEAWVLHATPEWSTAEWETDPEVVCSRLSEEFFTVVSAEGASVAGLNGHRWRYALAPEPIDDGFLGSAKEGLLFAGDWAMGGRVEGAYRSGLRVAEAILAAGRAPR